MKPSSSSLTAGTCTPVQAPQQAAARQLSVNPRAAVAQESPDAPPVMDKPVPKPAKTYQQAKIGEVLEKEYGVMKGGPSRNRRAGEED